MKYRAEMADLRNFYNDKGVLFLLCVFGNLKQGDLKRKGIILVCLLLN